MVKGELISLAETPTKEGYIFGGWYFDSALTKMVPPNMRAEQNMTLYASWLSDTNIAVGKPDVAPVVPVEPTDVPQTGDSWLGNLF